MLNSRLSQYFRENESAEITPMLLWAAHKCVIRGELISLAARRKKVRQAHIAKLSGRIHSLRKIHKHSLAAHVLTELLQARETLLDELGKTIRRKYALWRGGYFMNSSTNPGNCSQEPSKLKKRRQQFTLSQKVLRINSNNSTQNYTTYLPPTHQRELQTEKRWSQTSSINTAPTLSHLRKQLH